MATIFSSVARNWLVMLLIGLLLGSVVTAAYAYSGLSGLVGEQSVKDLFSGLDVEIKRIEEKLDANLIDVNGSLIDYLDNWFKNINKTISSLNLTLTTKTINNINNSITNINNNILVLINKINNINNNIQNITNNIDLIFNTLNDIDIQVNNVLLVKINEIYTFITVDIYQSIQSISVAITSIQNTLNNIYIDIRQINFLVQKRVIIETIPRSEYSTQYHHEFYVQLSVQGDGAVPESGIYSIGVLDAVGTYSIIETSYPGLYIVSVDLVPETPPGQYVMVINGYAVVTLPDGSTRTYNGTTIETLYVY